MDYRRGRKARRDRSVSDFEDDINDYAYKQWERQRQAEREAKQEAAEYAKVDEFIEKFFNDNWQRKEPTKLYDKKTGKAEWVWSEGPPKGDVHVALPQHVRSGSKVPNTLREMVEGRRD